VPPGNPLGEHVRRAIAAGRHNSNPSSHTRTIWVCPRQPAQARSGPSARRRRERTAPFPRTLPPISKGAQWRRLGPPWSRCCSYLRPPDYQISTEAQRRSGVIQRPPAGRSVRYRIDPPTGNFPSPRPGPCCKAVFRASFAPRTENGSPECWRAETSWVCDSYARRLGDAINPATSSLAESESQPCFFSRFREDATTEYDLPRNARHPSTVHRRV